MDNLLIIAIQLKEHRKLKKLSQTELAELTGFSRSFISLLESNQARNVTFRNLEKIFEFLGVQITVNYLPLN